MAKAIEIEQQRTEERITERFLKEVGEGKTAATTIMQSIAVEEGYTLEGIRRMLIRKEVYPLSKSTDNDYTEKTGG